MDGGQGLEEDEAAPPEYLFNIRVREGIPALLVLDHAKEEQTRLQVEGSAMITWVDTQLKNIQTTLEACTSLCLVCYSLCITDLYFLSDVPFHQQLKLHEKGLIQLGQQWRNETEAFLEVTSWPKALGLKAASQLDDDDDDDDDDSIFNLDGFDSPDSVLEVDDHHVSFLEEQETADHDEVERIVALVDQTELRA